MKKKIIFHCWRADLRRECIVYRVGHHYTIGIFNTSKTGIIDPKPIYTGNTRPTCSRKNAIEGALRLMFNNLDLRS